MIYNVITNKRPFKVEADKFLFAADEAAKLIDNYNLVNNLYDEYVDEPKDDNMANIMKSNKEILLRLEVEIDYEKPIKWEKYFFISIGILAMAVIFYYFYTTKLKFFNYNF